MSKVKVARVEGAGSLGSIRRITDQNGATRFNSSAGIVPLTSDRPDSGVGLNIARNSVMLGQG